MSAQETLFLHPGTLSTAALALITVSKPSPASERFSALSFSEVWLFVWINTEASQPCLKKKKTNKNKKKEHSQIHQNVKEFSSKKQERGV